MVYIHNYVIIREWTSYSYNYIEQFICHCKGIIIHTYMVYPLDFLLLVKVNLHPLRVLLRVIHLPWLCMPLLSPHWLTHFVAISRMYLRLGLRMMLLLLDMQLTLLLQWWKQILSLDPLYGYHPNTAKTYLNAKPQLYDSAKQLFQNTNVQKTCHGQHHLVLWLGQSYLWLSEQNPTHVRTQTDIHFIAPALDYSYTK